MTDDQLARLHAVASLAKEAEAERVRVITEIHNEGVALRDIARALGMTHPGIRKIIQRSKKP